MDYKKLSEELINYILYVEDSYDVIRTLIGLGYDYDNLLVLGFDSDEIKLAARDDMYNV